MENKDFDFHEIKTFEDACKCLGLNSGCLTYPGKEGNKAPFLQAYAYYQLLIIQKAINHGVWRDENKFSYTPFFLFYSEDKVKGMGNVEKREIGIDGYIPCFNVYTMRKVYAYSMYPITCGCDEFTNSYMPFRFKSHEAALYATKQFEDLFLNYYGYEILK